MKNLGRNRGSSCRIVPGVTGDPPANGATRDRQSVVAVCWPAGAGPRYTSSLSDCHRGSYPLASTRYRRSSAGQGCTWMPRVPGDCQAIHRRSGEIETKNDEADGVDGTRQGVDDHHAPDRGVGPTRRKSSARYDETCIRTGRDGARSSTGAPGSSRRLAGTAPPRNGTQELSIRQAAAIGTPRRGPRNSP